MAPLEVPLQDLQGEWVASRGEVIKVSGNDLSINGRPMPGGLKLSKDGQKVVGFGIYEATAGSGSTEVIWQAGFQEIIWRRPAEGEVESRSHFYQDQTASQGTSRAAAANSGGAAWGIQSEREAVSKLNELIQRWREGPAKPVRSCDICPDWSNRAETGLSVDHVHYVATMMATDGFKSRRRQKEGTQDFQGRAHDVPVLVREVADSQRGRDTMEKWRRAIAETPEFPPFLLDGTKQFFCSLGNGHFSQALNLFRTESPNKWDGRPYLVGDDEALQEALDDGVESVILSPEMPMSDRRFVSEMLNKANGRKWLVSDDGQIHVDAEGTAEMAGSQFEALSKVLDAEELSVLVRLKLHVDSDGRPIDRHKEFEDNRPTDQDLDDIVSQDAGPAPVPTTVPTPVPTSGPTPVPTRSRL
jgi:hypothetical protein